VAADVPYPTSRPVRPRAAPHRALYVTLAFVAGVFALAVVWWHALQGTGPTRPATTPQPPRSAPAVTLSEIWYATTPSKGVWAEWKIVLDNPLATKASRTYILVPATVMQDFSIRSTEPRMITPARRSADGRFLLTFPAPLPRSLNWYRINLVVRGARARPVQFGVLLDGVPGVSETTPVTAQVFYADRKADPFKVVPEPLVGWLPGQARGAFPVLVAYALAVGATVVGGTFAALLLLRRAIA
jgi:hypothetical protein